MPMPRMMEISGSSPRLLWEITDGITLLWERVMQIPAAPPHRLPDPWLRAALLGLETNQCPSLSPTPRIHTTLQHAGNVRMAATNNRAARLHLSVVSASGSVPCVVRKCILSHLLPYKTTTTKTISTVPSEKPGPPLGRGLTASSATTPIPTATATRILTKTIDPDRGCCSV